MGCARGTYPAAMTDCAPGTVDLLGVLAYGELTAFLRMAEDAVAHAPTLNDRAALAGVAANEHRHFRLLRDKLESLGIDPGEAMAPFVEAIDEWHRLTTPKDWPETLVKAYVGIGIAGDFYREAARRADSEIRELVEQVLAEDDRSEFVVERVRAALDADPRLSGRLALYARRLVGEALAQAHHVAVARPQLAALLVAGEGEDLAGISKLFAQLTEEHGKRMSALGLTPGP